MKIVKQPSVQIRIPGRQIALAVLRESVAAPERLDVFGAGDLRAGTGGIQRAIRDFDRTDGMCRQRGRSVDIERRAEARRLSRRERCVPVT